jgi:tetrapyrrole methylase family protein/MazG family protein/ATP diphosphatase
MAREEGHFSVDDVLERLSNKLVDRHPHVFGDVKAETPAAVLRNWEAIKAQEKEKENERKKQLVAGTGADKNNGSVNQPDRNHLASVLAGVSSKMPALMEAYKLSSRAANVGFDWPEVDGLFEKLAEETAELRAELMRGNMEGVSLGPSGKGIAGSGKPKFQVEGRERIEDEVGDLFFVLVNIARYLSLDPESALRKTNRKFRRRFQWIEERIRASGRSLQESSMEELEALWQEAKRQENPRA